MKQNTNKQTNRATNNNLKSDIVYINSNILIISVWHSIVSTYCMVSYGCFSEICKF